MSKTHQLLAFLITFIWGTNFVFIKYGLDELPPFLFATLRFFLVAFPLVFFFPKPKASWSLIATYGVLIGFGQFGLMYYAMRSDISAGLASLMLQTQVFFSIIFAIFLFKESLKTTQWLALALALTGIVLIAMNIEAQTTKLGLVLILLAAMSLALGNMTVKKAGNVDIITFLAYSSLFSIPILGSLSLYFEGWTLIKNSLESATINSVYVLLWQSISNTLIGYGIWNYLLNRYDATIVTPWALLVPVFGMIASNLMLSEPMPYWKLIAAFLILTGLGINLYSSQQSKKI